jgi:Sulfotransferase family
VRKQLRVKLIRWRRHWRDVYGWRRLPAKALHELRWRVSSREAIAERTERGLGLGEGDYWLFVLGLNNSGTSLLTRVLESHPRIRSLGAEGQLLTKALPSPEGYGVWRNWTKRLDVFHWTEESDPAPATRVRYDWAFYAEPGPGILLEKSPPNAVRSRWFQRHFAPSRFIAVVRSPYAVSEGIRRRTGLSIEDAALHWARGNETLLEDGSHLDHFLVLTYEGLCARPEEQLERVEGFLELETPFDRSVVAEPIVVREVGGKPRPILDRNAESIERLTPDEVETINRIAGPVMERLGYARVEPGVAAAGPS